MHQWEKGHYHFTTPLSQGFKPLLITVNYCCGRLHPHVPVISASLSDSAAPSAVANGVKAFSR